MKKAPQIGQTVQVETKKGKKIKIDITAVEKVIGGWIVWGYRSGTSVLKYHRTTSFPNPYYVIRT